MLRATCTTRVSVTTDIRDLSVHLSMRELVIRSNSSSGQPPFSGVGVRGQRSRTNPTGHLRMTLAFPEGIHGPSVSSWGQCALDKWPIRWGRCWAFVPASSGFRWEGGGWAEQLRVWKHWVNRAFRTLTGHWSLSTKTSHLSSDKYRERKE